MKKNPWIAAVLNLVITGAGYIYVGKRVSFGALLLVADLFAYYWMFTDPVGQKLMENGLITIAGLLYLFAFAYDAYKDAKSA